MKSEAISEFWTWFARDAGAIGFDPSSAEFVRALDEKVQNVDPGLSWEIGPGQVKSWALVISAGFRTELRPTVNALIESSPKLPEWEYLTSRPPKKWNYVFELQREEGESVRIDASEWTFVLLANPDSSREIVLKGNEVSELSEEERQEAATIVLESILGEENLMEFAGNYELVGDFDSRLIPGQRSIKELPEAI